MIVKIASTSRTSGYQFRFSLATGKTASSERIDGSQWRQVSSGAHHAPIFARPSFLPPHGAVARGNVLSASGRGEHGLEARRRARNRGRSSPVSACVVVRRFHERETRQAKSDVHGFRRSRGIKNVGEKPCYSGGAGQASDRASWPGRPCHAFRFRSDHEDRLRGNRYNGRRKNTLHHERMKAGRFPPRRIRGSLGDEGNTPASLEIKDRTVKGYS